MNAGGHLDEGTFAWYTRGVTEAPGSGLVAVLPLNLEDSGS